MSSNDSTSDANAIGFFLLAAMCLAAGIALGNLGRESDRALIAQQSREIYQLQQDLVTTKARFEGYRDGRR